MIANCPACGTHYKHEILANPLRGRCGRCDAAIDLRRLRPYRIVPSRAPGPPAGAFAETVLATAIVASVEATDTGTTATGFDLRPGPVIPTAPPQPALPAWDTDDPLPPIPEMAGRDPYESSVPPVTEADILEASDESDTGVPERASGPGRSEGRLTTWVLWLAAGAIAGTGTSWALGGTTLMGLTSGSVAGALAGLGWLRWTSPR